MPPPGWVAPAAPALSAPERVSPDPGGLRSENRRYLDNRRAVARLADWVLVFGVAKLVSRGWGDALSELALFQCLLLIYNHLFEVTTGATIGKRLAGLRVASLDTGGLPSPRQAATRGVIGIVEIGVVAAIAIIVNKQRRRLGDYAAGTAVVDARRHPAPPRSLFAGAIVYPVLWLVPTLVVCATAAGRTQDSYRSDVNRLCAQADAAVLGVPSYGDAQTVYALLDQRDRLVAAREVPGAWQVRHRQLVAALAEQTEGVRQSANTWARDVDVSRFAVVVARLSLHRPGYEAC